MVRPPVDPAHDRLLRAPVFLLSSVRSGSTLLRVLLNSHSQIHSPIETHFRRMTVGLPTDPVRQAMELLGHTHSDIEHIVWDRMLHRELARSGKPILVEKTPSNVFAWRRVSTCWPDARFIFLLRHPASIMQSWHEGDPENRPLEEAVPRTLSYMTYLQEARTHLRGATVRYGRWSPTPRRSSGGSARSSASSGSPECWNTGTRTTAGSSRASATGARRSTAARSCRADRCPHPRRCPRSSGRSARSGAISERSSLVAHSPPPGSAEAV
nr:hypothetical protein GCM10020093_010630 [Planobispora longispora]